MRLAPAAARLGDHEAAVSALQTVLRSAPDSSAAWEALGAAYDALNRHSAALKAYGRAIDIERERTTNSIDDPGGGVFASVRSGRIMHQMGAVRESIAAYEHALAVAPGHTAALLGLAEAELGRARLAAGRGAPGVAIAAAERAAEAATRSSLSTGTDAPKRTAVKLIGDAAMVVARCRDPSGDRARPRGATRSPRGSKPSAAAVVARAAARRRRRAAPAARTPGRSTWSRTRRARGATSRGVRRGGRRVRESRRRVTVRRVASRRNVATSPAVPAQGAAGGRRGSGDVDGDRHLRAGYRPTRDVARGERRWLARCRTRGAPRVVGARSALPAPRGAGADPGSEAFSSPARSGAR